MEYQNKIDADALAKFHREQEPLDAEAVVLFESGWSGRPVQWDEFTPRQQDHWRKVAMKAREIHAHPMCHEIAAASALEEAASAAQDDQLATAAEVIYDLCARAAELRARVVIKAGPEA
jgi:hypothetical protein